MKILVTKTGFFTCLLLVILVGAGALSIQNNILLLTASLVLAALIVSLPIAVLNVQGIECRCQLPDEAWAGQRLLVSLTARRRYRRFCSWWISACLEAPALAEPVTAVWPVLAPEEEIEIQVPCNPRTRGRHSLGSGRLSSRFPTGFWLVGRAWRDPREILIFPALIESEGRLLPQAIVSGGRFRRELDDPSNLDNIREYQPGDPLSRIHWPTSARKGRLMVSETYVRHRPRFVVRLLPGGWESESDYELAISAVATIAREAAELDCEMALQAGRTAVPFGRGPGHMHRMQRQLALLPFWNRHQEWFLAVRTTTNPFGFGDAAVDVSVRFGQISVEARMLA